MLDFNECPLPFGVPDGVGEEGLDELGAAQSGACRIKSAEGVTP